MILTEEEAKTKLCPEAIGLGDISWEMVPTGRMCIGSACMAWRWREQPKPAAMEFVILPAGAKPDPKEDLTFEEGDSKGATWSRPAAAVHGLGYCGKAGRP